MEEKVTSIPVNEQETVVVFCRDENFAKISTSDSTMKTKFDNLCKKSPDMWRCIENDGYYKMYIVEDKTLISYRQKKKEISDETKEARSQMFKELHAEGKIGHKKK